MGWDEWTALKKERRRQRQTIGERYRLDPVGYFRDQLNITPWSRQAALLEDVANHPRVIVRSGHKVSKSCSAAGLALWWIETQTDATALITAPTGHQIKNIVWEELRARYRAVRHRLGGEFPRDPMTGFHAANRNRIIGLATNEPERLGGISAPNLLVVIDEGSGFDDALFEVIEGNIAGGGRLVAFGNPTLTTGWFFEAFRGRRGTWQKHHISSEETPNVTEGRIVIPGLATREWVMEMREKYGPDYQTHPVYAVRVAGDFAEHASDAVIGMKAVTEAQDRYPTARPEGPLRIGVDVARFGDDETVIQAVRGHFAFPCKLLHSQDGPQVAGHVLSVVEQYREGDTRIPVNVDGVGVGASVYDALKYSPAAKSRVIEVYDVQAGAMSTDDDHHNLRSQLWFGLDEWLKEGAAIPFDSDLEQELLAPVYTFDVRGRKKVERKEDIRKKIKRSPDRADALAMAVHVAPKPFRLRPLHIRNL